MRKVISVEDLTEEERKEFSDLLESEYRRGLERSAKIAKLAAKQKSTCEKARRDAISKEIGQ